MSSWRESGWENASETTKKLLRHWWREERARRLFFCQIEAVETIFYRKAEDALLTLAGEWKERFAQLQAGRRWVSAVNRWSRLGEWDFLVCRDPQ